jgi:hypothetical protein
MRSNLTDLTQINLDDLVSSFGWQKYPLPARLVRSLFFGPARTFARHMLEFDSAVGNIGLPGASKMLLKRYTQQVRVFGADHIPASAFLALSNHPGMADTLALFAALDSSDLKIIALDRPFLLGLLNISRRLFYVRDDTASRMLLVRQVSTHLRAGKPVLTFPAGEIEPDPDVYPGALESLENWTDSAGVFIRMAPETAILPVLVRGVIRAKSTRNILLGFKNQREDREKLTAALQLLAHVLFKQTDVNIRVQIGRPIYARQLGTTDTHAIHQAVLTEMKQLIENPPVGTGTDIMLP